MDNRYSWSPSQRCDHSELVLGPGKGPQVASFRCKRCGAFGGWCSKDLYSDLRQEAFTDSMQAWADRGRDPDAAG
jgi:hypothetical protein